MPVQEDGFIGRMVGGMIRRTLKKQFHTIYWLPPDPVPTGPVIFVCSHTMWHDGYLMFRAVTELGIPTLDWIAEFDSFPFFRKVGGLPYPPHDPARRAATLRESIRLMKSEGWSLILFADGNLKRPHEEWQVGRACEVIKKHVPEAVVIPVALRSELSLHQRPEAFIWFGDPLPPGENLKERAKTRLDEMLSNYDSGLWKPLMTGTLDVNERMDMRKAPKFLKR